MRLIDVDAFKNDYRMANECKDCQTPVRTCEYDRVYAKMDFCEWLDSASTVQPVQRWIPCSERLPIEPRHYLCSFNRPNRIDKIYVDLAYWTGGRWCGYRPDQINAWMPLPKPYGGDECETD